MIFTVLRLKADNTSIDIPVNIYELEGDERFDIQDQLEAKFGIELEWAEENDNPILETPFQGEIYPTQEGIFGQSINNYMWVYSVPLNEMVPLVIKDYKEENHKENIALFLKLCERKGFVIIDSPDTVAELV